MSIIVRFDIKFQSNKRRSAAINKSAVVNGWHRNIPDDCHNIPRLSFSFFHNRRSSGDNKQTHRPPFLPMRRQKKKKKLRRRSSKTDDRLRHFSKKKVTGGGRLFKETGDSPRSNGRQHFPEKKKLSAP